MTESGPRLFTGENNAYHWLVLSPVIQGRQIKIPLADTRTDVLRLCPDVVVGKYVAITSFDSGPLRLREVEQSAGWTAHDGIAYSPKIQDASRVPQEYFSEMYIFERPTGLGALVDPHVNVFEQGIQHAQVVAFVNFDFSLHDPEYADIAELFWQQVGWIKPDSYLALNDYLTFVSANRSTFEAVHERLRQLW